MSLKKEYVIKLTDAEREILKNSLRGMYDGTLVKKIVLLNKSKRLEQHNGQCLNVTSTRNTHIHQGVTTFEPDQHVTQKTFAFCGKKVLAYGTIN